jgi:hypothetical protein
MYRLLIGKPERKRPLGRPGWRWVDNIKVDLADIGFCGMDWIDVAQDRDTWRAANLLSGYTPDGLSSNAQLHRVS